MFLQVCVCPQRGGLPQWMLGYHPLKKQTPPRSRLPGADPPGADPLLSRPTPRGEIEGDQVQTYTQGRNWGGSDPGPHPRGKLRGSDPGPHPRGKLRGSDPGPHPRGKLRGIRSSPRCRACWEIRSTRGRYASYWNAILLTSKTTNI